MSGAIVFDLDGTLVDSAPDIRAALNRVLAGENAEPVTLAETVSFVGHGIPQLVRQAREARGLGPDRQDPMTAAMLAGYLAEPAALTRPYPGVTACLERLCALGHPLGLCTNKALAPTLAILDALDLGRFFGVVIGGDSLPQKKPDPAPLHAAFAALGTPLLYVGDSEVDAATAEATGVAFALFTKGYRKAPVTALRHSFAFDRFDDLARHLDGRAALSPTAG
ncbi:phosphoglycolate phosphatase [Albidovulum sediminis]|uniref:Phosphoglycolate phosphatase n=1 Tax=Albidovulum sediminis TaxID=3066345 RepID=A0ABT2NMJ0_9RHOB|nr:phosphoglycolate phosphatase [Defluviimonas sediminis]